MALIKCSNCGHIISDKTEKCPHCQTIISQFEGVIRRYKTFLIIFSVIGIVASFRNFLIDIFLLADIDMNYLAIFDFLPSYIWGFIWCVWLIGIVWLLIQPQKNKVIRIVGITFMLLSSVGRYLSVLSWDVSCVLELLSWILVLISLKGLLKYCAYFKACALLLIAIIPGIISSILGELLSNGSFDDIEAMYNVLFNVIDISRVIPDYYESISSVLDISIIIGILAEINRQTRKQLLKQY